MTKRRLNTSHANILNRLKRTRGHLESLIRMIEEGRPCLDLAQQFQAVESAIANAKAVMIHDHIDHCLGTASHASGVGRRALLAEFRKITKYL